MGGTDSSGTSSEPERSQRFFLLDWRFYGYGILFATPLIPATLLTIGLVNIVLNISVIDLSSMSGIQGFLIATIMFVTTAIGFGVRSRMKLEVGWAGGGNLEELILYGLGTLQLTIVIITVTWLLNLFVPITSLLKDFLPVLILQIAVSIFFLCSQVLVESLRT